MLSSVMEWLRSVLSTVLPLSPFQDFIDQFRELPFLAYLNWFVPVRGILTVLTAWLAAIAAFYLYSILLRWLKVLGD